VIRGESTLLHRGPAAASEGRRIRGEGRKGGRVRVGKRKSVVGKRTRKREQ